MSGVWLPALLNCKTNVRRPVRGEERPRGPSITLLPKPLTVCGDVNFFRKLRHIYFKPILNIVEDFGIILIRHKSDSQAFGAKATCTCHLVEVGV